MYLACILVDRECRKQGNWFGSEEVEHWSGSYNSNI